MEQAVGTTSLYLRQAIAEIDQALGEGYAAKHPELIAGFMQAAASDYLAWQLGVCTAHLVDSIGNRPIALARRA